MTQHMLPTAAPTTRSRSLLAISKYPLLSHPACHLSKSLLACLHRFPALLSAAILFLIVLSPAQGETWSTGTNTVTGISTFTSLDISGGTNTITSTGILTVEPGDLNFFGSSTTPNLIINSGGTLKLGGNVTVNSTVTSASISDTGTLDLNGADRTFTVDNGGAGLSITASINGAWCDLIKAGSGTLTLTGTNSYAGATSVNAGTLSIASGGTVSDSDGYIGYDSGSTGTVTVDGRGSQWNNSGELKIGEDGTGTLNITNGGTVNVGSSGTGTAYLGSESGSSGTLNIGGATPGAGTAGTLNAGTLNGGPGTAILNFNQTDATIFSASIIGSTHVNQNGPGTTTLTAANTYTGVTTVSAGTLTVTSGGSIDGTSTVTIDGAASGSPTLSVSASGSSVTSTGTMTVGWSDTGTLNITNGGTLSNYSYGYIGYNSYSAGTVTVDGSGSQWNNSSDLFVGFSGTGSLSITNGGTVSDSAGYIGNNSGSTGTVTVDGIGSLWNNGGVLVAPSGTGTLSITNGGKVVSGAGGLVGLHRGSNGTVMVDGTGSQWNTGGKLVVGCYIGGTGTLSITNGGTVSSVEGEIGSESGATGTVTVDGIGSQWNNSGELKVSTYGGSTGTLSITNGGTAVNTSGYIGMNFVSTGTVKVDGTGSQWINSSQLTVGLYGTGTLSITDGGTVGNTSGYIGRASGSTGRVTVGGTGSQWNNSSDLSVGKGGTGTLRVINGGKASNTVGHIGFEAGSTGTVTVDGMGSQWENSGELKVGGYGTGTLHITNGGKVSNTDGHIGFEAGSTGTVTVDGTGSHWENSEFLDVGNGGTGTLNITNGGKVSNTYGHIGNKPGSTGAVTVDGTGSHWENSEFLDVGYLGTGTLNITNGGTVSDRYGFIGIISSATGTVTVDGTGSQWNNSIELVVGEDGSGTLNIQNGGTVNVGNTGKGRVTLSFLGPASRTLNIGGATPGAGTAGTLNAAMIISGAGTGIVNFNQTDATSFSPSIIGSMKVNQNGPGTTTISTANHYAGDTTINAGTLATVNAKALGNSAVTINGGILAPTGALNIRAMTWNGGSIALSHLLSDVINVDDALTNGGAGGHFIVGAVGMAPNQLYPLVNFASTNFTLDQFSHSAANRYVQYQSIFVLSGTSVGVEVFSATASGPSLQNSSPVGIPTFADFTVNGPVSTGTTTENNTINSLTFAPGSSLQIYSTLNVTSGNITQAGGSSSISGGTIAANELNINTVGNLTVNGNILTTGDLTKTGGGKLILAAGSNSIVGGDAGLLAGNLVLDGRLQTTTLEVARGALLTGTGLLIGDLYNNGTVNPGHSPGTLTVHGNYTQTRGGTLVLEVQSLTNHDRLIVSGHARVAGTLDVRNYGGNKMTYGDLITGFLQAGSISGHFNTIKMPSANLRGRVINSGDMLSLLAAPASYTLVAHNANETSLAMALDKWIGIETGDVGEVTLALDLLKEEQYASAFAAISPAYYGYIAQTNMEKTISNNQLLGQRLSALRSGARGVSVQGAGANSFTGSSAKDAKGSKQVSVTNADEDRWGSFVQLTGQFADVQTTGILGDQGKSSMGGALIGADYRLSERTVIGLSLGYDVTWLNDQTQSNNSIDTESLTAYGSMGLGQGFFVNGTLGASYSSYSVKRPIVFSSINRTATADTNGRQLFASVEFGKDIKAGHWTFTPSTGIQYTDLSIDGTDETGAGALGLMLGNVSANSLRFHVGAQLAYVAKLSASVTAVPYVHASWQHEFSDKALSIRAMLAEGGGAFNYTSAPLSRDRALVGAGVNFLIGPAITLNLGYQADLSDNYTSQLIFLQLGRKF